MKVHVCASVAVALKVTLCVKGAQQASNVNGGHRMALVRVHKRASGAAQLARLTLNMKVNTLRIVMKATEKTTSMQNCEEGHTHTHTHIR